MSLELDKIQFEKALYIREEFLILIDNIINFLKPYTQECPNLSLRYDLTGREIRPDDFRELNQELLKTKEKLEWCIKRSKLELQYIKQRSD